MQLTAEQIERLKEIDPCLAKLKPEEPIFILRGQDPTAWVLAHAWAVMNAAHLGQDHEKIKGARRKAEQLRAWPFQKPAD